MNRWLRTGVLFSALSVTGFLGYHINWTAHNVAQKPDDASEVFLKDVNDCSLERAVGLFYDKHVQLPLRLERVMDAYFGGCVNYASNLALERMEIKSNEIMSGVRAMYCEKYNAGEIEGEPRYNCS